MQLKYAFHLCVFNFWYYLSTYKKTAMPWATGCLRAATLMPAFYLCWAFASHSSNKIPFFHKIWRNLISMRFLHLYQIWGKWGKRLLLREDGTVFCYFAPCFSSRNSSCKSRSRGWRPPEHHVPVPWTFSTPDNVSYLWGGNYLNFQQALYSPQTPKYWRNPCLPLWQLHFTAFSLSYTKCQRCWWDSRGDLRAQHGIECVTAASAQGGCFTQTQK